jgi:DNA-binding NarL/FixJ family response regulator
MIRILLVDDQVIIRQGLKALLELQEDLQVVGSADNGQTAIEQVEALQPDVVLIDIQMPGMDGVTATRIICQRFAGTKVLVLSGYDDNEYLADALRAGARGYLLKDTPAEELASAIRSIHKGYAQIGPGLFEKIPFGVPALNSVDSDEVSLGLTELTPIALQVLPEAKSFDIKALPEVVRLAVERGAVVELFTHVNNQLKRDPSNLAALYLAGVLAHRGQGHKMLALNYLRLGFKEGIKQGLPQDSLLLFYQEGALLEPEEAFTWLTQLDGPWNSEEGFSFLLQEAEQMFGRDSIHCRALFALWQIGSIRALSESYACLEPMLEVLNQGFERIGKVLKG